VTNMLTRSIAPPGVTGLDRPNRHLVLANPVLAFAHLDRACLARDPDLVDLGPAFAIVAGCPYLGLASDLTTC
jgi:hypothetical protein